VTLIDVLIKVLLKLQFVSFLLRCLTPY